MKYLSLGVLGAIFGLILTAQNALALTVSPIKMEISGDPGQTLSGEVYLFNEQDQEITFYSAFKKFEAQGETGNPVFSPTSEGLASWIQIAPTVTLQPKERLTVPYRISIPQNATPGGNFAAIFWNTTPPDDLETGQVGLSSQVGILVLLRVSGDIAEKGALLEFGTEKNQTSFTTPPVNFWYRFSNNGTDRVKPSGTVTIKNTFGLTTTKFNANPTDGNVLPDSIRRLTTVWNDKDHWGNDVKPPADQSFGSLAWHEFKHFHFGRFTAKLHLEYGTEGKTADAKISFLMIPWHALAIVLPTLFIVLVLGIITMKRYNRWIIRRAHGSKGQA